MSTIVVGDSTDPHVTAVVAHLDDPVIFDASSLHEHHYELGLDTFTIDGRTFSGDTACRGWIRRLAPAAWSHGTKSGSHRAATQAAAVSLVAAVARTPGIDWLTDIDSLLIAESKLVQMRVASSLGIRVPATVVTTSRDVARARLGHDVVIKPLGPGTYTRHDGAESIVYATRVDLDDASFADLGPTPFLIQEPVEARTHHRVVTVASSTWVTSLDAAERPLDWRSQEDAHHSFRHDQAPDPDLCASAQQLASNLGLGYSSQDWIRSTAGDPVLLDVNPGGQWAFLPEPVTGEVTLALATWLQEEV